MTGAEVGPTYAQQLDSLNNMLDLKLSKVNRLEVLHSACELLYQQDLDQKQLVSYAQEGVELAKTLDDVEKGSDMAVWILRANIYLSLIHI